MNLASLPELHSKLIQLKYLSRSSDGKYQSDDFVYTELNLNRAAYYRLKKMHFIG